MSNTAKSPKNYEAIAAKAPTQLHEEFAHWLYIQTGVKVDLKTVQLVTSLRMDFQASPENQKSLADRKAKAAAAKKASAARKKAKLEAELAKLAGKVAEPVATEPVKAEEPAKVEDAEPVKLTIVYGSGEPQVHKFGCADLKKMTRAKGFSKETALVASHSELTHLIYADQIDSGEATIEECSGGYDAKPCCPALND